MAASEGEPAEKLADMSAPDQEVARDEETWCAWQPFNRAVRMDAAVLAETLGLSLIHI